MYCTYSLYVYIDQNFLFYNGFIVETYQTLTSFFSCFTFILKTRSLGSRLLLFDP